MSGETQRVAEGAVASTRVRWMEQVKSVVEESYTYSVFFLDHRVYNPRHVKVVAPSIPNDSITDDPLPSSPRRAPPDIALPPA